MSHEFTVEVLYHFNCGECKNWWSQTSTPTFDQTTLTWGVAGKYIHCPHCGHETDAEIKENFFEKSTKKT